MGKRRFFTLMEMTIAFGLIAIIVGLLMNSMRTTILLAEQTSSMRKVVLERHKCYTRLLQVFSAAKTDSFKIEDKGLAFSFVNGLDPELKFSGPVDAVLSIDETNNLVLTIASKESSKKRVEYLFPSVKGVDFEKIGEEILLLTLRDQREQEISFSCLLVKAS